MNTDFFLRASLASAMLLVGLDALAAGTKENPCTEENLINCYDGVSGAVTGFDAVRVAIPSIKTQFSSKDEDEAAFNYSTSGLAAGSLTGNYNIWANASYSEFESTFVIGSYEAERTGLLVGVDRMIGAKSVLGVAFGYEDLSTTTFYNGGSDSEDGFTIAPYYGVVLTDSLTFDMSLGYSWLDHSQNRLRADGNRLFASYDADRL
ncbi:MAG: autotransporter outer membrane beta-barrel domain-containing protein, partial [Gammaproteobacteria bacterium]|nr:autotransporter outer membrane beta-barrel domain-containing protein [Gammaproteobacteria bacterium]